MAATTLNIEKITVDQLPAAMRLAWAAGQVLCIWGPPGTAKSSVCHQTAVADYGNGTMGYIESRPSHWDISDVRGVPYFEGDYTVFKIPNEFPRVERDGESGVWLIDEPFQASPSVTNTLSQLLTPQADGKHRLGDYVLTDGWHIVMCTNRPEDKSATQRVGAHIMNRLVHVEVVATVKGWLPWAKANGIRDEVMYYLRAKEEAAQRHDPATVASPTLRTWEKVSRILDVPADPDIRRALICGAVGSADGTEFCLYMDILPSLPSIGQIEADPDGTQVPDEVSHRYALIGMMVRRVGVDNIDALSQYMSRMSGEFQVLFWVEACERHDVLRHTDAFVRHEIATKHLRVD